MTISNSTVSGNATISLSGGWWTGYIGVGEAGTDAYVTVAGINSIKVDFWKAIANSIWSGSTVITISGITIAAPESETLYTNREFSLSNPAQQTKAVTFTTSKTTIATLTVNDDGTFSLT